MMNEAVPEVKQPERELLKAAKSTQSVTRQQLSKRLVHSVAMVVVDDLGGEHYLPGNGINLDVPKSITAALNGRDANKWKEAIEDEMQSIYNAGALSGPVELPAGEKITNLKFIFVKKVGEDGLVNRFKARLVYDHRGKGEEEENNYSPVANKTSLRIFLATVAQQKWEMVQADVKTAFLNADNPGMEYVRLPKQVVDHENQRIRILQKALYGLQRAPKMWHLTFSNWAIEAGFEQSQHDPCLFLHSENEQMLMT